MEQSLTIVLGVVLTALVTVLISMVSRLQDQLTKFIDKQECLNDRLTILETEHKSGKYHCMLRESQPMQGNA